jgi:hypothetical protein
LTTATRQEIGDFVDKSISIASGAASAPRFERNFLHKKWIYELRGDVLVLRRIFGPRGDEETGEWRKLHNRFVLFAKYY